MESLIAFAVQRRWLVLVLTFLLAGVGVYQLKSLPVDAVPDITNVQVVVNTQAEGYSPLEAEQRITYPIENAMAGVPQLDYSRSLSRYGLSQVVLIFHEGTDIYWARQQVSERLQTIRNDLPAGVEPSLGPIASGLGEIFSYVVRAKAGALRADGAPYSAEDLRTVQDWIVRPQLIRVPGITEINSIGGYEREYEVVPEPGKLLAYKLDISDVLEALQRNNQNQGAGFIERNGEQWLIRSPSQLKNLPDIGAVVIAKRDDAPVRIRDVAQVRYAKQLRNGAASQNGEEVVLGTAFMLLGENSRTVAAAVAAKLAQLNSSLPPGVEAVGLYNRSSLVDKTISTVRNNLFEGAVLVIVVLFTLLGNIRAAFIAALIIPLSMLFAVSGMAANRVSGNLMSLGAIDFGLIVDGAVIVIENTLRRLAIAQRQLGRVLSVEERLQEVLRGTQEVIQPAVFGMFIIMLVYLPIFALSGVEGKMFHPMAFTVVAALLGAMLFSITFVPAAIAIIMGGRIGEKENKLMATARQAYQPLLALSMRAPLLVLFISASLVVASAWQVNRMGSEFLPKLDEHDIAMHALRIPGTGLDQSLAMQQQLEKVVVSFEEVSHVFSKIGTPEIATDPMPPSVADTYVILKPKSQWPNPDKTKAQLVDQLRDAVSQVPGNQYEFTQPIEMRFNELIAGVRADVAVRVYGDDMAVLEAAARQVSQLLASVEGASDVQLQRLTGLPMLSVEPELDHLALLGLSAEDVQDSVRAAVSGLEAGVIYEGDKRFRLMLRYAQVYRKDPEALARLPVAVAEVDNPELRYVPLGEIARIKTIQGPNQVNRQSGKRNVVVTANVEGRDLGSFISATQTVMEKQLKLPAGYWIDYGGTFKQLQSANERLSIVVPLTLLLILGILYSTFNSLRDALIIFTGIPLALTGGVLALSLRGMPLSISAIIGFIALSGVAVLNGVVMLSFIRDLRNNGMALLAAINEGASARLRPVLMTALVASLGFVPMAFNSGAGAQVQRPLATVVIGGIVSSTLLTLLLLPALYKLVYRARS